MELDRAKDLMIPVQEYPHILYTAPLCEAIAVLERAQLDVDGKKSLPRTILIFDEKKELVGCVRRRDLLRGADPETLVSLMLPALALNKDAVRPEIPQEVLERIRANLQRPVSDVMTPIKNSVDYRDDVIKMANKLVEANTSFLPVMKVHVVVGVVRTVEILHEMFKVCNVKTA
ncbi:hypothetical protein ACFL2T_07335 [Elusimicrobiota bacterium]